METENYVLKINDLCTTSVYILSDLVLFLCHLYIVSLQYTFTYRILVSYLSLLLLINCTKLKEFIFFLFPHLNVGNSSFIVKLFNKEQYIVSDKRLCISISLVNPSFMPKQSPTLFPEVLLISENDFLFIFITANRE